MKRFQVALAVMGLGLAGGAMANDVRTPPGDPCSKGNGNPCNGNNGNSGSQGNSGHGNPRPAPVMSIPRPAVLDRHVYITQIGTGNEAVVRQEAPNGFSRIGQAGDGNDVDIVQRGTATAYAELNQVGIGNDSVISQSGSAAGNTLYAVQTGAANLLTSRQTAQTGANAAVLSQLGSANTMNLTQSGGDNMAELAQVGDRNVMDASQSGEGNRLTWTQAGTALSNLVIKQSGGQSALIVQVK